MTNKKGNNRKSSLHAFNSLLGGKDLEELNKAYNTKPTGPVIGPGSEPVVEAPAETKVEAEEKKEPVVEAPAETKVEAGEKKEPVVEAPAETKVELGEKKEPVVEAPAETKVELGEKKEPVVEAPAETKVELGGKKKPVVEAPAEDEDQEPAYKAPTTEEIKKYLTIRIDKKNDKALTILVGSEHYEGIKDKTAMLDYIIKYFLSRKKTQEILKEGIKF
jgi:hypothetical protein